MTKRPWKPVNQLPKPTWFSSRKEKDVNTQLTKATLEQIFIQVDADPLAGRGHLSKREILIDRVLAHVRSCVVDKAPTNPRPILENEQADVLDLKVAAQ